MLSTSLEKIEAEVAILEEKVDKIKEGKTELKVDLYARFGRSINLET